MFLKMERTTESKADVQDKMVCYNWTEVKDEMFAACKELKLGELVHDARLE